MNHLKSLELCIFLLFMDKKIKIDKHYKEITFLLNFLYVIFIPLCFYFYLLYRCPSEHKKNSRHFKSIIVWQNISYYCKNGTSVNQQQNQLMKSTFGGIARHQSEVDRSCKIQRIKSSLRSFPILSRNQTKIKKRISENFDLHQEHHSSDNQSIENQQELNPFFIDHIELFLEKYQLKEKIGEGSNGVVHRCIKKRTGENYAVKFFMYDDEQLPELKANFLIMKSLSHPCIIKYEALYIDVQKHAGWLVMEFINSPSLSKAHFSTQNQVRNMFRQVVQSLSYLHKRGIAHRDIKLQNILFNPEAKSIKIIDFGICRKYRKKGIKVEMWTITGTLYYRAPQMLIGGGYTEKTDIWASGILLYKVIIGKTPFESEYHQNTLSNILNKELEYSHVFDGYSSSLFGLIKKMINRNPKERLSAQQILKQDWFTENITQRELNHTVEQDCEGLSPIEPKFRRFKEYIKEINGDQYHCIDSDEQHEKKAKGGKHKKTISLTQVDFLI